MPRSIPMYVFVTGCLLLVPALSGAAEQTDVLLNQASAKYANLEFEEAADLLQQALKNKDNSRSQLVRIHHLLGLTLGSLGRYSDAKASFGRLLALDPSFRLGSDVAPRIQAPFHELLQNPPRLEVRLLPPPSAVKDKPVVFSVKVADDSIGMVRQIRLWFRREGQASFSSIHAKVEGEGDYQLTIPAPMWQEDPQDKSKALSGALSWHAVVQDENDGELKRFGSDLHPLAMDVTDRPKMGVGVAAEPEWYEKWWVWTIVGGVLLAGTTTAVILATSKEPDSFDFTVDVQ